MHAHASSRATLNIVGVPAAAPHAAYRTRESQRLQGSPTLRLTQNDGPAGRTPVVQVRLEASDGLDSVDGRMD